MGEDAQPTQKRTSPAKTSDALKELETAVDALLEALERCRQNEQRLQEILSHRDKT